MKEKLIIFLLMSLIVLSSCTDNSASSVDDTDNASEKVTIITLYDVPGTVIIDSFSQGTSFTDFDEFKKFENTKTHTSHTRFESISCIGEFQSVSLSYTEHTIIGASYAIQDDNGVMIRSEGCDKPSINAEYEGLSDLRKYPITSDYRLLTFEYEGIIYRYYFSDEVLVEGILQEIIIPVTKDNSKYMKLSIDGKSFTDYPTDGEETFISRLLNADTVASAKAELEKCILGE